MAKAFRVLSSFVMLLIGASSASPTSAQTPAKEGFIDAGNGVKLYYRLVGTGSEPVVLIHGGPGFTSDYLADDLMPMARNHSLLVYDQRGIGRSTLVSDSTALAAERYVEDLEAIRKHLGLEQLTLLGHSWGVVPATLYAMQYPRARAPHDLCRHHSGAAKRVGKRVCSDGRRPGQCDVATYDRALANP